MGNLGNKRVAIIGTGATAVQCIPALARDSMELYVFQRTPSAVDVRGNGPIDPERFRSIATPQWQDRYLDNFAMNWEGVFGRPGPDVEVENLFPGDGFTEIGRRIRAAMHSVPASEMTPERLADAVQESDDAEMEAIRARVDAVIAGHETAERLKAWYGRLCKRPCYHDDYLPAFNRPNTHLVDTDGKGIERITKSGVVANGVEYEVDCIVYASGFDYAVDILYGLKFDVVGREGLNLSKEWADGPKTLHGMHAAGFPNLFVVQLAQGSFFGSSVPINWTDTAKTIAAVTKEALERGSKAVVPAEQAQGAWVDMIVRDGQVWGAEACTPGYYNNEGAGPGPNGKLFTGDPRGSLAFFTYIDEWRTSRNFEGLQFD
jgi:cyclohexanone monooxygenase